MSINMIVQNRRLKHESTTFLQHSLALSVEIECFYSVPGDHLSFIRTVGGEPREWRNILERLPAMSLFFSPPPYPSTLSIFL